MAARQKTIAEKLSQYGTLVSFYAQSFTRNSNKCSEWIDEKGSNDFVQNTANNQPVIRLVGNRLMIQYDSVVAGKELEISPNPFAGITNGTIVVVFRIVDSQYILFGPGTSGAFGFAAFDGNGTTSIHSNFGSPSYYVNGTLQAWGNRDQVHDGIPQSQFNVVVAKGVNLSTWANFNIGAFNGTISTSGYYPNNMQVAALAVFSDNLSDGDRGAVENILTNEYSNLDLEEYSFDNSYTVVADTISGNNAANTGLDYDDQDNEILISEFATTFTANILRLRESDKAELGRINVLPHLYNIQGLTVDNRDPDNKVYYVIGTPQTGSGNLHAFDSAGNLLYRYNVLMAGANLDYSNGFLFYLDNSVPEIRVYEVGNGSITLVQSKPIYQRISNPASVEGLHVEYPSYYIMNEGAITRKYRWSDNVVVAELSTGLTEIEGVTVLGDNSIAINDDSYFHGGTPNGNKLHIYNRL